MKAILEFDLPDEQHEHKLAIDGQKWSCAMWDIDQHLRSILKYEDNISEEVYDKVDSIREKLYQCLEDNGVSFNDVP
jgi:hypothetical protein